MSSGTVPQQNASSSSAPKLRRSLKLWDLILYGVIVIQPVAPMGVFGVIYTNAGGHVVTTILIAMFAMLLTAISYGKMARAYPSAGSAFTYVGQEINPTLGYVTGWSMVMDYILNPLICIIFCSDLSAGYAPAVPHLLWYVFYFILFTGLNLFGVKTSARVNSALAAFMGVVVALFFIAAARYIFGHARGSDFFTMPFYDPSTYHTGKVLWGTSLAVLTYIGFDGISTLSEEAENPRRNILLATVFTCLIIGLLSAAEVYAAQLVWPSGSGTFSSNDTAFVDVTKRAGASLLFHGRNWLFGVLNLTLLIANIGSGMGAQLGAARLLYGMGRSNALPKSFFGALDAKRHIPRNNVIFVGVIAVTGAVLGGLLVKDAYGLGAEMLNFGALIAFMGVNLAALMRYFVRSPEKKVANLVFPIAGFVICLLLWLNLGTLAKIVGAIWMAAGIAFGAWKTRGFKSELVNFDIPAEDEV